MLIVVCLAAATTLLQASGHYRGRPPKPPTAGHKQDVPDQGKYALGKKIFTGKEARATQPGVDTAQQEARLKALQARLPEKTQSGTNLPALAGKLSERELEALEYYVRERYPVR